VRLVRFTELNTYHRKINDDPYEYAWEITPRRDFYLNPEHVATVSDWNTSRDADLPPVTQIETRDGLYRTVAGTLDSTMAKLLEEGF